MTFFPWPIFYTNTLASVNLFSTVIPDMDAKEKGAFHKSTLYFCTLFKMLSSPFERRAKRADRTVCLQALIT